MHNRQEEQYETAERIGQQEQPSILGQVIALVLFFGFIIGLPTIVEKLK